MLTEAGLDYPYELYRLALGEEPLLAVDLLDGIHGAPLEGRVGLGHVAADGHGDPRAAAVVAAPDVLHAPAELHDPADVLVLLGGQADHKVELEPSARPGEGGQGAAQDVVVDVRHILNGNGFVAQKFSLPIQIPGRGNRRRVAAINVFITKDVVIASGIC